TGRITPGITERISGLAASSSSRMPRTPSMMLCSILSRSLAVRRRILSPAFSAAQRYEPAQRGHAGIDAPAILRDHPQLLVLALAHRNHQAPGIVQLLQQRSRDVRRAGGHGDGVI